MGKSHQSSISGLVLKLGVSGTGAALILLVCLFYYAQAPAAISQAPETARQAMSAEDVERARQYFTDTEMTTQEGRQVRFYSDLLHGRVVMINVIYTSCMGACPLITQKLSMVSRELGDLFGEQVQFVSVTNDPERDSPQALAEFADKQGVNLDGWTFVTGSKPEIENVIRKIGLYTPQIEQHKSMLLIGNTRTGHWQKLPPNLPHESMALKLKELAAEG